MKKLLAVVFMLAALLLAACAAADTPTQDRAGQAIAVPAQVERIACLAPSTSEILDALGFAEKLVAVDTNTAAQLESAQELPAFDMMAPDCEALYALEPDVVFVSGMSMSGGDNPYQPLIDLGVCVVDIPSSSSIAAIEEDILFVGDVMSAHDAAELIVQNMQQELDAVAEIAAGITEKKTVLFEISAAPYIYSFGQGTFLNEMLELIGADNVFGAEQSWIPVSEEQAIAANPDVILTSVNYLDDPVGEILSREGWESVTAVAEGSVYQIDANSSNQPNQNIVIALREMALAIYPEAYEALYAQE